jgi:hypothetical protein
MVNHVSFSFTNLLRMVCCHLFNLVKIALNTVIAVLRSLHNVSQTLCDVCIYFVFYILDLKLLLLLIYSNRQKVSFLLFSLFNFLLILVLDRVLESHVKLTFGFRKNFSFHLSILGWVLFAQSFSHQILLSIVVKFYCY